MTNSQSSFKVYINKHKWVYISVLLFGVIYALISLVNHYNFRTYTYDLGIYTNALYDYIHLQWNDSYTFKTNGENLLADHFDLYLLLFSPLSLLFGTYTLLIVQIAAVLAGGIGLYYFLFNRYGSLPLSIGGALYFYCFFGIYSALAGDYHSNVVAASLLPWFFYFIHLKRWIAASAMLLFLLIAKENMGLWLGFVCLGMCIDFRKQRFASFYLSVAAVFCFCYFYASIHWFMPSFAKDHHAYNLKYSYLGSTVPEIIMHLLKHPVDSVKVLFINHTNNDVAEGVKTSLHLILLTSGLPFLIKKPQYLLMLIPIYFQKLYHDDFLKWSISFQYNIEFAAIFAIGIFSVISEIKSTRLKKSMIILAVILSFGSTVKMMDSNTVFIKRSQLRFYKTEHYLRTYNVKKAHEVLESIPTNAIVSAQPPFLPHLALRENVYTFPFIWNATYLVFSYHDEERGSFSSEEDFIHFTDSLKQSDKWKVIYDKEMTVLKKKH